MYVINGKGRFNEKGYFMHKVFTSVLTAVFCLALSSAFAADPTTDEQKTFYALGVALSRQALGRFNLSEAELEMVKIGHY